MPNRGSTIGRTEHFGARRKYSLPVAGDVLASHDRAEWGTSTLPLARAGPYRGIMLEDLIRPLAGSTLLWFVLAVSTGLVLMDLSARVPAKRLTLFGQRRAPRLVDGPAAGQELTGMHGGRREPSDSGDTLIALAAAFRGFRGNLTAPPSHATAAQQLAFQERVRALVRDMRALH